MELKLKKLIDNVVGIANLQSLDSTNSIVVRLSNSYTAKINVFVCSFYEPLDLILPINVTWINSNPSSQFYMQALVRVNKTNVAGDNFTHQWRVATQYSAVMAEQTYTNEDSVLLANSASIGFATATKQGLVKLSCKPGTTHVVDGVDVDLPIAVGINDYRLTNKREPTEHVHAPVPATLFATSGTLNIEIQELAASETNLGKVLKIISVNPPKAAWVSLVAADFPAV